MLPEVVIKHMLQDLCSNELSSFSTYLHDNALLVDHGKNREAEGKEAIVHYLGTAYHGLTCHAPQADDIRLETDAMYAATIETHRQDNGQAIDISLKISFVFNEGLIEEVHIEEG